MRSHPRSRPAAGAALLFVVLTLVAAVALPSSAYAVDGFDKLRFGMSPEDVRVAYPDQVVHDPNPRSAPADTIGGRLVLTGKPQLFEKVVEVSCYFTTSGLSIIRLQYAAPDEPNVATFLDWYRPYWGEPVRAIEREGARKKVTSSWPWEGVEFRSVYEEGKVAYQRVDFSEQVKVRWTRADAVVCKLLPKTSSCPFPDDFCPQQDATLADGKRTHPIDIAGRSAETTCTYEDYSLQDMRLTMAEPDDLATDWLGTILLRRLGPGDETRQGDSSRVRIDTVWSDHGVELRVVRKARVKTEAGWTGPAEFVRVKRVER